MNYVAKSTVGVYLIHEHPGMRVLLWQRWFPFDGVYGSGLFILASLLVPTAIFVGCLAVDMGRRALFSVASRSVWGRKEAVCPGRIRCRRQPYDKERRLAPSGHDPSRPESR